ncbi:MAG: sigma-70 family RNA polymerase sigma factor [Bacteroidota bacterium]
MKPSLTSEDEFLEVLEDHKKLIFKISGAYFPEKEERKDLFQEIVLQLWKAFPSYKKEYAYSTWIYRIALNVSISFLRKKGKRSKNIQLLKEDMISVDWEDNLQQERLELLYKAIEKLPPLDKAIMLMVLEGFKHAEIAEVMGLSATNVSSKIHRIKQKLSSNLNPQKQQK